VGKFSADCELDFVIDVADSSCWNLSTLALGNRGKTAIFTTTFAYFFLLFFYGVHYTTTLYRIKCISKAGSGIHLRSQALICPIL
jgi:hypothetical protein